MNTATTSDQNVLTQQPDGRWLSATGDEYDYPLDHQHFYHTKTGEVVLLPPGEYIPCLRIKAFGILSEVIFLFQGEQLTLDQLAGKGWMDALATLAI